MKQSYPVRYRNQGDKLFTTIKNVIGDQTLYARTDWIQQPDGVTFLPVNYEALFRAFHTADDEIHYVPMTAVVIFPKERQVAITKEMSDQTGQPIQRA